MRTMQEKVLEAIQDRVAALEEDLEVLHDQRGSNVGTLYVQARGRFTTLAVVEYRFWKQSATLRLRVGAVAADAAAEHVAALTAVQEPPTGRDPLERAFDLNASYDDAGAVEAFLDALGAVVSGR